jgi:hypothetical protein
MIFEKTIQKCDGNKVEKMVKELNLKNKYRRRFGIQASQ